SSNRTRLDPEWPASGGVYSGYGRRYRSCGDELRQCCIRLTEFPRRTARYIRICCGRRGFQLYRRYLAIDCRVSVWDDHFYRPFLVGADGRDRANHLAVDQQNPGKMGALSATTP